MYPRNHVCQGFPAVWSEKVDKQGGLLISASVSRPQYGFQEMLLRNFRDVESTGSGRSFFGREMNSERTRSGQFAASKITGSADEFGSGHAAPSFQLQLEDLQLVIAATDQESFAQLFDRTHGTLGGCGRQAGA